MKPAIVHSAETDIFVPVLSWFHPFDGRKFSRAWKRVQAALGKQIHPMHHGFADAEIKACIADALDPTFIETLKDSRVVAKAVGVKALAFLPNAVLQRKILRPMRAAVAGTCRAALEALTRGTVFNFGGGFHHAHRDHSEGFCIYNDVAVAAQLLRRRGLVKADAPVWLVDLDAHRGNGNEAAFWNDPTMHILDIFNQEAYPGPLVGGEKRYPHLLGISSGTKTDDYLSLMKQRLAAFMTESPKPAIAFYNAGTDIVDGDPLGRQNVSEEGVFQRDKFVLETLSAAGIPTVMMTSGGYAEASHRLIARTAEWLLRGGLSERG